MTINTANNSSPQTGHPGTLDEIPERVRQLAMIAGERTRGRKTPGKIARWLQQDMHAPTATTFHGAP